MNVNVIGTGTSDDPRRPDLPEGTAYTVVEDRGDTMTVEVDRTSMTEARLDALLDRLADATTIAQVREAARDTRGPTREERP